jgi:L-methionine (R)-S-oxide reductase
VPSLPLAQALLLFLPTNVSDSKTQHYREVFAALTSLCEDEDNEIAVMATIVAELHHRMPGFDWTGFYRVTQPRHLKIGPYQGGHGCLNIPFERGVCGMAATQKATQIVPDVNALPYHIACSSSTLSEIVVPVFDAQGELQAVLDVDSNQLAHFDDSDAEWLEKIVTFLLPCYPSSAT